MNSISLPTIRKPFRATVRVPGSKSITNRALPLAAMAEGTSTLTGVLFADDTWAMIKALQSLGYHLVIDEPTRTITLHGRGKNIPNVTATLHCGNSGTTLRFLAAMLTNGPGQYTLDGIERMRQRPVAQLVDQLRALGATVVYGMQDGYPPITVGGSIPGGTCAFRDAQSSQYISAILMAAPLAGGPVTIRLDGRVTSEPYVDMTVRMIEGFGCKELFTIVTKHRPLADGVAYEITPDSYTPRDYCIEPDASNASYFLAAAALTKDATITIPGLGKDSLQGDVAFAAVLQNMGASVTIGGDSITATGTGILHGLDLDMNHIPDMVQTLAVVALFADSPTTIRNVANLRIKETDRLAALETELRKLGAAITTTANSIHIIPPTTFTPASIATYDDHRMAMAFSLAALHIPGTVIENPQCTAKTYPDFFVDLRAAVTST